MSLLKKNDIDYNEIPDSLNLEGGVYPEAAVTAAKLITIKSTGIQNLVLTFKDMDPDSDTFGKDFGYFIKIPNPAVMDKKDLDNASLYFKRNLKMMGLSDHQIENLDDPELDSDSKDWLLEIEGVLQLKKNGQYTNLVKFERTSPNSAITEGGGEVRKVQREDPVNEPKESTPDPVAAVASSDDWD